MDNTVLRYDFGVFVLCHAGVNIQPVLIHNFEISQGLFKLWVSAEKICGYWNTNAFKKYKAVRKQLGHTGGGDPDAARNAGEPRTVQPEKHSDVTFSAVKDFSAEVLLKFYESDIYDLIDRVYVSLYDMACSCKGS